MKSNRKFIALFLIIAMANITPASAMSLGDINNHLENNLDSYNKLSWWDKIWHLGDVIASLSQVASELSAEIKDLNDQAINSQKEAENLKNKLEYLNSQINNRKVENIAEAEYKNSGIADTKRAIRSNSNNNSEQTNTGNIANQSINHNNSSNSSNNSSDDNESESSSNQTNILNSSANINENSSSVNISNNNSNINNDSKSNESLNNSSKNNSTNKSKKTSSKISVSDYAKEDGEKYPEAYFKSNDIKYSKLILSVSQLKKGQIVQILKDGVFKYWVFNGLTQEDGVTYINLVTGNGKNYQDDIESFNDDFTGLTYEVDESPDEENPYHSVKKIQELEIQSLNSLNNKIYEQSTWASISNYILITGGAVTAIGFVLGAACALFAIIYSIAVAAAATIVLGIPCSTIATIAAWAAVITGIGSVILLAIGIPLTVGGGIALGVLNSINDGDKSEYNRLKDDYNSDEL